MLYVRCDNKYSLYKFVDIHSKEISGEIIDTSQYLYKYARISSDEKYIAMHIGDTVLVYDTTFTKLYQLENVGYNGLQTAYFKNGILIINTIEKGVLNKYDLATGALLERIQIHEVQH
ncbi:MAG: hypothetical protein GX409_12350 [candidate division Zixibacteria bacterium]|nr:hypothetical protein [candidate division Zixibacteria bacterium]